MKRSVSQQDRGIKLLVRKGRKRFRIKENLRYYLPDDLKKAEKKFIKKCILQGICQI
jgi:hypothetical protein